MNCCKNPNCDCGMEIKTAEGNKCLCNYEGLRENGNIELETVD